MPELIWYKRFPQDWMSDPKLGRCSPMARGVWADIIENLYLGNSPYLIGTIADLARICRCSEADFSVAIEELKRQEVGVFEYAEGMHKICCRRILRDFNLKELKRKAANTRWSKDDAHAMQTDDAQGHARSASASASASEYASDCVSTSAYDPAPKRVKFQEPTEDQVVLLAAKSGLPEIEARKFFNYYAANGWMVGRHKMKSLAAAITNWRLKYESGTYERHPGAGSRPNGRAYDENPRNRGTFETKTDFAAASRKLEKVRPPQVAGQMDLPQSGSQQAGG